MCVSRFVGSAQAMALERGLVYTGSSGSPSLKASVSLGHTGLCTSDPGLHADAVLVSPPPNMEEVDSEDARHPRTPARLQHPFPPTRGEGQPQHRPPLQDGKASDQTPLLLLLREHSTLGPSLDQLVISDAPGAPPSVTSEPERAAGPLLPQAGPGPVLGWSGAPGRPLSTGSPGPGPITS